MSDLPPGVVDLEDEELPPGVVAIPGPNADGVRVPGPDEKPGDDGPGWSHVSSTLEKISDADPEPLLHGARKGASLGFDDELGALMQAIGGMTDADNKPIDGYWDRYRVARDGNRAEEKLLSDKPGYTTGEIGGGIIPALATGGSLGAASAIGGGIGLGDSEHDLTDLEEHPSELAGAALDTGIGAGVGALSEYGGRKLGDLLGFLKGKFGQQASKASGELTNEAGANLEERANHLRGHEGPPQAKMAREIEKADAYGTELSPEEQAKVELFKENQNPKIKENIGNYKSPKEIPGPTAEDISSEAEQLHNTDIQQFYDKMGTVGHNISEKLPFGVGEFVKAGKDAIGTVKKYGSSPGVRKSFYEWMEGRMASDPAKFGKWAGVVLKSSNPAVDDFVLSQTDGEWRKLKEEYEQDDGTEDRQNP